jgi:K+-sensing histidine kinase KdpD
MADRLLWATIAIAIVSIVGLAALTGGTWVPFLPILLLLLVAVAIRFYQRRDQAEAHARVQAHAEATRKAEEERLRQRLEAIDQARMNFLQALAHDFRTPIASLEALARALDRPADGLSAEERSTMLELVESHARQLGSMLEEIQEVANTQSLGSELRVEVTDVYMPELIGRAAASAGVPEDRLAMAIDPGLNALRTDDHKMRRILTYLLDNANKHSPADEPLEVRLRRSGRSVQLAVLDRGPGIPPELAARALEKLVVFGHHRSSGLGMWVVAQFVAALGGSVALDARPGGGLVVRLTFPVERLRPVGVWREEPEPAPPVVDLDLSDQGQETPEPTAAS